MKNSCPCRAVRPVLVPQKSPIQKEHFEMVRAAIMHEDNLVNHRLTWLLAAHAFLLTFFTYTQRTIFVEKNNPFLLETELFLCVVFAGAAWLSLIVSRAVLCANLHIGHLKKWWEKKYPGEKRDEIHLKHFSLNFNTPPDIRPTKYPPICGSFARGAPFHLSLMPYLLATLDVLLMAACALISWHFLFH